MAFIKHSDQRIGIFIDIQNLYHSARNLYGARVNYAELIKNLTDGRKLIRAIAYVVSSDPQTGEELFFEALEKTGIELRSKEIQIFPDGTKKADWDVGMAVDAIRLADSLDVIVLVTGDGDFMPLVQYLKWGLGKVVEVAAFGKTASGRLREEADGFYDLEKMPRITFRSSKSKKPTKYGAK
ncbi:MAG: NYN domain-containing protein [Patescibacteria group bacterium]|nr:NYN domain-containing protein [Patescibacteria group bacterium]MCL5262192.1 NYN domain-containing protein [Patescibacteria group bacterium]